LADVDNRDIYQTLRHGPFNDFGAGMLFEPGDQARLNFFPMVMEQPDGGFVSGF